jgi:hypothetical protein
VAPTPNAKHDVYCLIAAKDLLVPLERTLALINTSRKTPDPDNALVNRLESNYSAIEEMAYRELENMRDTDFDFSTLKTSIASTGSHRLLDFLMDAQPDTIIIGYEKARFLVEACSVDYFHKALKTGIKARYLMVPMMEVSDERPDIRAFLMDELADTHLACDKRGSAPWDNITQLVIHGPESAALGRWYNDQSFNTILHILLGAPPEIFFEGVGTNYENKLVYAQISSGHGKLRMIRHFGDIEENRAALVGLYDSYIEMIAENP